MTSCLVSLGIICFILLVEAHLHHGLVSISITRHHKGDMFVAQGTKCYKDLCVGMSSGTAGPSESDECGCQCMQNLPIFRDDLNICVDDIHECTLAPFVSGTTTQKIPYVFLPLKGQIVYPSAEITVSDMATPICVVSGAQFLSRGGWVDLRNNSNTEPPFRLFRDEGRTYLQWLGESDMRLAMEGRLILVHLMCKDANGEEQHKIYTPCVAFRVAGNPSVREVMFATDVQQEGSGGLSISEYVAIGVCSILLGLIYVASVFLYLHLRKRKQKENKGKEGDNAHLTVGEEGIVKSNPLLQATRRHLAAVAGGQDNAAYSSDSGSCCSESDGASDICPEEESGNGHQNHNHNHNHQNLQISAMVHPYDMQYNSPEPLLNQDSNNIERLPEEDVSIVETPEGREDRPETVRGMGTANVRRKLYFNPAYFELDLLKAPPPAALEFLTKIREVISIAKCKMSAKRFSPSLNGIPEEDYYSKGAAGKSRPGSVLSVAGSDGKKSTKKKPCPGCDENEERKIIESNYNAAASGSCCPSDTKQRIIRKWLEDVPIIKSYQEKNKAQQKAAPPPPKRQQESPKESPKRQDSPKYQASPKRQESPKRQGSPKYQASPKMQESPKRQGSPKYQASPKMQESPKRQGSPKYQASPKLEKDNCTVVNEIAKPPPPPGRNAEHKRPSTKGPAPPRPPPPNQIPEEKKEDPEKFERREFPNFSTFSNFSFFSSSFKNRPIPETPPPIPKSNPGPLPSVINKVNVTPPPRIKSPPCPPPLPPIPTEDPDIHPRVQGKDKVPPLVAKTLMDAVIKELVVQRKCDKKLPATPVHNFKGKNAERLFDEKFEADSLERKSDKFEHVIDMVEEKTDNKPEEVEQIEQIDSSIIIYGERKDDEVIESVIETEAPATKLSDDHDYEVIHVNPENMEEEDKDKDLKIYNLPEILSKNERSEGYSLVSEVYVNDGYSYSSGSSSPSNTSDNKLRNEKPGRLTIQVKDSPENYKHVKDETDAFEPDTLDRKPGKMRIVGSITNWEDSANEKYSNQMFHDMDMECQHKRNNYPTNETYMDSLERPQILLKTPGSFRRNSLEKEVNELFRNLDNPLAKNFGSLREIYEAKSKNHKRRTETTSLVGSVTSDTDCGSTLSWSEDRRNKLLHRGIVLHMGSNENRKHRRSRNHMKIHYPDVVPPRPPKPASLSATPVQRSAANTPATRSYCPSPATRSVCASPPPRSVCTSPSPRSACASPPPIFSPNRSACTTPPPRSGRASSSRSGRNSPRSCMSPPPRSGRVSPSRSGRNSPKSCMSPPPRSICASPLPRAMCATSPCTTPCRSICPSPTPPPRSACTSPLPPPRPPTKPNDNSPPLPPRNLKPPLPPKNGKSTRQRKPGSNGYNLARRPLPPLPSPRHYNDSTLSSVSSRDLETLSTLSGASMDSLNSSDYEAFYTLPYEGNEGEIYDKALDRLSKKDFNIYSDDNYQSPFMLNSPITRSTENIFSTDEDIYNALPSRSSAAKHMRAKRTVDSVKKSWRKMAQQGFPHKPEDSGYLSTDSNESSRRKIRNLNITKIPERVETPGSQGSETEESLCDGASESGAESIATDSFFFGNFRKVKAVESLDSGVGSDLNKCYNHSFRLSDVEVNSDTERHAMPIMVRP